MWKLWLQFAITTTTYVCNGYSYNIDREVDGVKTGAQAGRQAGRNQGRRGNQNKPRGKMPSPPALQAQQAKGWKYCSRASKRGWAGEREENSSSLEKRGPLHATMVTSPMERTGVSARGRSDLALLLKTELDVVCQKYLTTVCECAKGGTQSVAPKVSQSHQMQRCTTMH